MKSTFTVRSFVLFIVVASLLFILNGCGGSSENTQTTQKPLGEELTQEHSFFYGGFIRLLGESIVKGSLEEISGDSLGVILDILGFGDQNDEKTLDDINSRLQTISNKIEQIAEEINQLNNEIKIDHDDIVANCNDPTDAVDKISSLWQELSNYAQEYNPGEMPRDEIKDFINKANDLYNIPYKVDRIYYSIIPQTSAKTPILNNYRILNAEKYKAGVSQFFTMWDGYLNFENYTAQLIANQLKGVAMVVDAKNAKAKEDNEKSDASIYFNDFYQKELKPEVWDIDNQMSFFYNALAYVWSLSNIYDEKDRDYFLSNENTLRVLQRADFFRRMVMLSNAKKDNESNPDEYKPGLYAMILAQRDFNPAIFYGIDGANSFLDCYYVWLNDVYDDGGTVPTSLTKNTTIQRYTLKGPYYAYWNGNQMNISNKYDLYMVNLSNIPSIKEKLSSISSSIPFLLYIGTGKNNVYRPLTASVVKVYNDNYTVTNPGKNSYPYTLAFLFERDNNPLFMDTSYWDYNTSNSSGNVQSSYYFDSQISSIPRSFPDISEIPYDSEDKVYAAYVFGSNNAFSNKGNLKVHFKYTGTTPLKVKIYYDAYIYTEAEAFVFYNPNIPISGEANAQVTVGIHDVSANKDNIDKTISSFSSSNQAIINKKHLQRAFEYELQPEHEYYLYFNLLVSGTSAGGDDNENAISVVAVKQVDIEVEN